MERCARCGAKVRGGPFHSPLGESVCEGCYSAVMGAAAAVLSGGGVGEAIALGRTQDGEPAGILGWIRRTLGSGRT